MFKYSERKYILNTLYIDKYILWIQSVDYPVLYDLSEEISVSLHVLMLFVVFTENKRKPRGTRSWNPRA